MNVFGKVVVGALGLSVSALAALGGGPLGSPAAAFSAPSGFLRGSGADLSLSQIGSVAETAGFSGPGLAMAIAVAEAESGGDPDATDDDANGTIDRGLWQINSVHAAYSPACDYDPACNASAAYAISAGGRDWTAWVTYQHGSEIAFLPAATAWVAAQGVRP